MGTLQNENFETRRIILLRRSSEGQLQVLLRAEGAGRVLPEVNTARGQRVVPQLTAALKTTWGIDAISSGPLQIRTELVYETMEQHGARHGAKDDYFWSAVDSLVESEFYCCGDYHAVIETAARTDVSAYKSSRGQFARLGWFQDLEQWVQQAIEPLGLRLDGRFRQLNASPTFSLVRFETNGQAVWFKAVGVPNLREFPLTVTLACQFPKFLPQVIANRPEWNGWLTREVEGPRLHECSSLRNWEVAARDIADLQIRALGRSAHLLDRSARDLRTSALIDLVKPFFEMMGEVMEQQAKLAPPPLPRAQLRDLAACVGDALTVLGETGIPNTLGHLDLNPGNIVISPVGCVFLDWAEAFVGHPFLTFQYLIEHFRRAVGTMPSQEELLVAHYIAPWTSFVSGVAFRRAFKVVPLVAVFAYAAATEPWKDPKRIKEGSESAYLRSLTRRMHREARALSERGLSCAN